MQQLRAILSAIFFCVLGLLFPFISNGQAGTNADSLFTEARKAAFEGNNYPRAISYSRKAAAAAPNYTDIIIFLGRLYAWSKNYDSSKYFFGQALKQKPELEDIYIGYSDLELWSSHYEQALEIIEKGLTQHPQSIPLLLRKAKTLENLRRYQEAATIANSILSTDRGNTEARALAERIKNDISLNSVGIKYDYVYFDKQPPDPWHYLSIDYTRQTKAGSVTARVNYANRFAKNGLQYEIESYPRISKTFYSFVNFAYSDGADGVFPKWRAGLSLWVNLPSAFEAEAGARYLYFDKNTFFYTVYLGKYYKQFLFGARTYLVPHQTDISQSYSLLTRYYFGGADDYVNLSLEYGISPDDRANIAQLNAGNKLTTYKGGIIFRKAIRSIHIITANISLANQRDLIDVRRNQVQAGIGYIRRF